MHLSFTEKKNIRKNFGKLKESLSIPNLIEVQKNSYKELTQKKEVNDQNLIKGFDRVFKSIFPIEDLNDKATLEYVSYRLEKPKFDVEECIARGLTYSSALKCTLRLVVYEIDQENNTKDILSAKEQEVYMGEVPMMTNSGTFITNGVQRVVVNQMHRSPGVFFDHDKGKSHASGKLLFNCRVIPNRGSWLDFEYDIKDFLYFRIDRKKKIFVTTLFQALGFSKSDIVNEFYDKENYTYDENLKKWKTKFDPENYKSKNFSEEIIDVKTNKIIVKVGEKINFLTAKKLSNDGLKEIYVSNQSIYGKFLHKEIKIGSEIIKIGLSGIMLKSKVMRNTALRYLAGTRIHELTDTEGNTYVLFAYEVDSMNFDRSYFEKADIMADYPYPRRWTYSSRIINEDLELNSDGIATVIANRSKTSSVWEQR